MGITYTLIILKKLQTVVIAVDALIDPVGRRPLGKLQVIQFIQHYLINLLTIYF